MSLVAMQRQPVYWFNADGSLGKRLTLDTLGQVETRANAEMGTEEPTVFVGVALQAGEEQGLGSNNGDPSVFVAKPSRAFAQSPSPVFSQLASQIAAQMAVRDHCASWASKAPFKYDEMLSSVTLRKYKRQDYYLIEICVLPMERGKRQSLKILQRLLAFCFAAAAASQESVTSFISEKDLASLTLYSFAWICSVLKTLCFTHYAQQMERLFVQNLQHFCKSTERRPDYYLFIMFLGSLAVRRSTPMQQVVEFIESHNMVNELKTHCESQRSGLVPLQQTFTQNTAQSIVNLLQAAQKFIAPKPAKDVEHRRAKRLLTMVDIFVAWAARTSNHVLVAQFDQIVCKIECLEKECHRRFLCTRQNDLRSMRMSLVDLGEWLRYMVLLQLDERNIHRETKFLLSASPCSIDFGPEPCLAFQDSGIDFLTFFLLQSEFVRASLHQARPSFLLMREIMLTDESLVQFIETKEPYRNCIILCESLLEYAARTLRLRTIQGVPLNKFHHF